MKGQSTLPQLPLAIAQNESEPVEPATEKNPSTTEVSDTARLEAIQFYNDGVDKLTSGDFNGAIAAFTASLELDPTDADAFYNRGYSHHVLGDFQAAFDDYGQATELNPEFADAYGNRCYAAYLLKNYDAALENCEAAIALTQANPDFFINRGNTYDDLAVIASENGNTTLASQHHEQAIADYDTAISLQPDHAKAYYNRALAYNRISDHQAAVRDYNASIERRSDFAEAYFNRGISHYQLDNTEQAIADLTKAAEIFGQQNQIENQAQALELLDTIQP
ncbi:hypothetical protein NIES208_10475 [[Limnothrix rosea] IAM M-220]|nr:hypothetical protein NIES208_10475 [[Limnothrix rosea] IAM M-220]